MVDLVLDSAIKFYVFLPIILITFFSEIIKYFLIVIVTKPDKPDYKSVLISHAIMRSKLLRENGKYLTKEAFNMRRHFFNDKDIGYFNIQKFDSIKDYQPPSKPFMSNSVKRTLIYFVSMIYLGSWINSAFSGFLTTRIPFPLTYRFKTMFQQGCEKLVVLDASWVSSVSWYVMNIFGLQSIYELVLDYGKSRKRPNAVEIQKYDKGFMKEFKAELKALESFDHIWALENVSNDLVLVKKRQSEKENDGSVEKE